MDDRDKIDCAKDALRLLYPVARLPELKAYSLVVFNQASDQVILTSQSSEGGSQSGEINCPKFLLLKAIQELIAEYDPENAQPTGSRIISPDWRYSSPV